MLKAILNLGISAESGRLLSRGKVGEVGEAVGEDLGDCACALIYSRGGE